MSQIQKFEEKLAAAKSVKELFSIPDVQDRFVKNYAAVTGKKDGLNRLEQERFAYLQLMVDKPDLRNVDNWYHMAALVFAGTTGLSFRDNQLYVIPNGKGLKVQSSPAGKRYQLELMSNVKSAPQAVLVMVGDHFVHDKMNNMVIEHKTTKDSKENLKLENIRAAYQRINYKDGTHVDTVVYADDLVKAKSKSKMKSDLSFWNEWPGRACEKVATNRAFSLYHKYPDNTVIYGDVDKEESDASYVEADVVVPDNVDPETGEEIQSPLPEEKKAESKKNFMD